MSKASRTAERLDHRLRRLDARAARLAAQSARLSRARLGLALAGGAAALAVASVWGAGAGWLVALAGGIAFAALARRHERIEQARTRLRRWHLVHTRHRARLCLDWDGLGAAPAPAPAGHPFAADLDVAGPRSVLHLLDTTATEEGHSRLRAWLLATSPDPEAVRQRQARVRRLVPAERLRDRLALLGLEAGQPPVGLARPDAARWSAAPLRAWLGSPSAGSSLRGWAVGLSALSVVTAGLLVVSLAGGPAVWTLAWFSYLTLYLWRYRSFAEVFDRAYSLQRVAGEAEAAFAFLEREAARTHAPLADVWQPFAGPDRPSVVYRRLRWIAGAASWTRNDIGRIVFNALVPYDLVLTLALDRLRERLEQSVPRWLDAYAETEALGALATVAALWPDATTFPTLADAPEASQRPAALVDARRLGHPLLPAETAVRNSLALAAGEVVVLTGSNMAGKSTFLRSVGVAVAMAWAGGPVVADRLDVAPLLPFASMRVGDALQEGVSTFYAEVRRLRRLLDAVEAPGGPPVLVLIDEMYRGTNNRERLAGARALVRALAGAPAASLVATHDLALTRLAGEVEAVRNAHFRERVAGGALVFDYQLREGPCPTTNALAIMADAGLPTEPPERGDV